MSLQLPFKSSSTFKRRLICFDFDDTICPGHFAPGFTLTNEDDPMDVSSFRFFQLDKVWIHLFHKIFKDPQNYTVILTLGSLQRMNYKMQLLLPKTWLLAKESKRCSLISGLGFLEKNKLNKIGSFNIMSAKYHTMAYLMSLKLGFTWSAIVTIGNKWTDLYFMYHLNKTKLSCLHEFYIKLVQEPTIGNLLSQTYYLIHIFPLICSFKGRWLFCTERIHPLLIPPPPNKNYLDYLYFLFQERTVARAQIALTFWESICFCKLQVIRYLEDNLRFQQLILMVFDYANFVCICKKKN